jgi:hypothetical protein
MLIDINKHYSDVVNYLSDTKLTKGLDEFISMYNSKLLNRESFNTCVKAVNRIDIMSTNECMDLDYKSIKVLLEYTKIIYKTIIIDTISGGSSISHNFFEASDFIIVVINQSRHILDFICKSELYKPYKGKLIFIVNRFMDKYEDKKFNFGLSQIIAQLNEAGYRDDILPLAFDMEVINECNDNAILNCVLNRNSEKNKYSNQLKKITNYLLNDDKNLKILSKNKRNNFLSFVSTKGAALFAARL